MRVDDEVAGALAARLDAASQARLGRSLAVFAVSAGDCGGCALEIGQLRRLGAGLARHGISLVAHPAAADVLLVSGAMTRALAEPLRRAHAAMARPCWVVAVGDCAGDGGPFAASGAVAGGVGAAVPVDLVVPGCPPPPDRVMEALLTVLEANG